jgi:hypothetical protein
MMKKKVILFSLVLMFNSLNAQIVLTSSLIDSVKSKLYTFDRTKNHNNIPIILDNCRRILNITTLKGQNNSLYVSSVTINWRANIHENMMIYINDVDVYFVILRNVEVDSGFRSKLIKYNDPRFEKVLDSIKFRKDPFSGWVIDRSPLEVFRIRRKPFNKRTFVVTSKKYIPYLSAPEEFIPLKKFAGSREFTEIEPWYYDYKPLKELNKKYYEDMKPREKIILRMPNDK